jgi:tetraacyldisaccharide 4'-kinase
VLGGILTVLSWLYCTGVVIRNAAFASGVLRVVRAGVPVISVGNITAGGTGKTPLVEYLIGYCSARGRKVGVLSRGYGRTSRGVRVVSDGQTLLADAGTGGDEPVQIASRFPAAVVVVAERRAEGARIAVQELGATLLIMDDGFQHQYLHRDLNIVVVNADRDVRKEPLLPAGRRREPLRAFRRAGFLLFSRVGDALAVDEAARNVLPWYRGPVAGFSYAPDRLGTTEGTAADPELLRRQGTGFAFCGIGDPDTFHATLREMGIRIAGHTWFPDHHPFTADELQEVRRRAADQGASFLITTEKDFMRLRSSAGLEDAGGGRLPVYHLRISVTMLKGEEEFHRAIDRCIGTTTRI